MLGYTGASPSLGSKWRDGRLALAQFPASGVSMSAISAAQIERLFPTPLPSALPPVPVFDSALVPSCVRPWLDEHADALQVPMEYVAVPAMISMGGCIGRQVAVALKQRNPWYEVPLLWGVLVGRPSAGKSPAISPARRMLDTIETAARQQYESVSLAHERAAQIERIESELAIKTVRKLVSRGDRGAAEAALAAVSKEERDGPREPRLVINDATIEKLGELLGENPRGLIYVRDEVAGWLANLDREGREGDRAFFLECWNGKGSFTFDRIGRGTTRIAACAVSIMGGVQPGKLAEYVRGAIKGGAADDGLIQRFQMSIYPDLPTVWRFRDFAPDPDSERNVLSLFRYLYALDPVKLQAESNDSCDIPFLRLSDDAQERFADWLTALMQRLRSGAEPPHLESHLSKYSALAGRLALVLHLAERAVGPVSDSAMATAIGWCTLLEAHARRIYAPVTDDGISAAHLILRKRPDLADGFTLRDVYRRGWTGLTDKRLAEGGLELLVEHGHLQSWTEGTAELGGRPSLQFRWFTH